MDTTTLNSMCRCCAAEGMFKDIKTSYHWMGEEEVYGDMLRECFDVKLVSVEDGGICEVCITQLRNASNFKKQVLHTEKKFKRILDSRQFKPTEVKEEVSGDENSSSEDNENDRDVDNDNIDDEDYVPDFEMPIKTESPEESKSRKRGAKATTSRAKKSRVADDEDKSIDYGGGKSIKSEDEPWACGTTVKVEKLKTEDALNNKTGTAKKCRKKNKQENTERRNRKSATDSVSELQELFKHRFNIRSLLQHSNATPIRTHYVGSGYICCFCDAHFPKAADLKTHTIRDHDDETKNKFMQRPSLHGFLVKLDITSLACNICNWTTDTLDQLVNHLNETHQKGLHTDVKSHIACFKLDDAMKCYVCAKAFNSFKYLQTHMNKHFTNFICDECGAGFINRKQLYRHAESHKAGTHRCRVCTKIFPSSLKMRNHLRTAHSTSGRYKCYHCKEKFINRNTKKIHMIKVHGLEFSDFKCDACDRTFKNSKCMAAHKLKDHLMERRYQCKLCDSGFFRSDRLRRHEASHAGHRDFKCDLCHKSYTRKCTLQEHMRSHSGER